jgi:hypothetical protein
MLSADQISANWDTFMSNIDAYISEPRRSQLKTFYTKYQERIMMMPASHKKEYHSAFPGGYIDHVNRVVLGAIKFHNLWAEMGCDTSTYTLEELVFSAINHDLGKMGDENYEAYIPQTDAWRKDKLGEDYTFNDRLAFASVPDRGLFLLQDFGIKYSFNEMVAIQIHDGLYDEGNKKYLMSYMPELKPRTALPYILHQADMMAARIEWETDYLPKFKGDKKVEVKPQPVNKFSIKQPKLSNPDAPFANLLKNI